MKVALEKSFPMPGSADVAWEFLQDIEAVAGCMPGAKITERLPDGRFKGTVTVKVGPASLSFRGDVEVLDSDPAHRSLRLLGKGTDSTGTSGASMDLRARVEPADGGLSNLIGSSEVSMSGKAAAFGGRMINSVADQILKQFAANFSARVAERAALRVTEKASTIPDPASVATSAGPAPPARVVEPADTSPPDAAITPPPAPATELNGLALVWAVLKDFLRGILGKKTA